MVRPNEIQATYDQAAAALAYVYNQFGLGQVECEMQIEILRKQMDESTFCPLCKASMFFIEADEFGRELNFHQCSHCEHQLFYEQRRNCHCAKCLKQRKSMTKATRLQEGRKLQRKQQAERMPIDLNQVSFIHKLFLLSLLDQFIQEGRQYHEYIDWKAIKYYPFSPNYQFQAELFKQLVAADLLIEKEDQFEQELYYINVRIDGYSEPSLFSICQRLRQLFYEQLKLGVPFKTADEVHDSLFLLLYQEIVQFMQFYCKTWHIQISGNRRFQSHCFQLMEHLAVGQIFYMIQNALEYLHQQQALQPRNDNFINTNLLNKTLMQYRKRALEEKWETPTLPRPPAIALSQMSDILYFKFLGYDDAIFVQPVWRSWKKIAPRLNFFSDKRCMHCGSNDLEIDYDAGQNVSLFCRKCKHQDHYFTG